MEIVKFELQEKINVKSHRKEKYFTDEYAVINLDEDNEYSRSLFIVRFYHTQSASYCCVWSYKNKPFNGSGKAGGYGYHRESQALENALKSCGIDFNESIGGKGYSQYESIFTLIANKLGYNNIYIHHAHG